VAALIPFAVERYWWHRYFHKPCGKSNIPQQLRQDHRGSRGAATLDRQSTRRSIVEEGRAIRQEISRIKNRPENIGAVLTAEADGLMQAYNATVRAHAPRLTSDRFDALVEQVHEALRHGRADDARRSYAEMIAIFLDGAKEQPGFHVDMFLSFMRERHLAIDKARHDRLIAEGEACIDRNDLDGLRRVIGQILENQYPTSAKKAASAALAGLMK
jgi:molecular chaperone DnaK